MATVRLVDVTMSGNSALDQGASGGGLLVASSGKITCRNVTVLGSSADNWGGGIQFGNPGSEQATCSVELLGCVIGNNSARTGPSQIGNSCSGSVVWGEGTTVVMTNGRQVRSRR